MSAARKGRGRAQKTIELVEAAYRILEEIQPASVRAVCYRLFAERLIDSMEKANTNKVSRLLTLEREEGNLPWEWIVDETRSAEVVSTWRDPEAIFKAAIRGYRKNYWAEQPEWVEVWSEKGTVRGTLAPVLDEFAITFRVMHGYGSATAINGVAEDTADSDKPLTILYVGDWDPSGLHMSELDLPERLERYGANAEIERIALTEEDVGDPALPSFEAASKANDPRYRWFVQNYGARCWELDALSPVVLRDRVNDAILERLDLDAWDHSVKFEAAEKSSMQEVMAMWRKSISGQAPK